MPAPRICSCETCRTCRARTSARRKTRALAYGNYDNGRRDPAKALAHVQHLRANGMGRRAIADAAGVSEAGIRRLADRKWISAELEAKLLDVTEPTISGTVPAWRVTRRLRALAAIGWSGHEIARRLDMTQANASLLAVGGRDNCMVATFNKVDALYRELLMTLGPSVQARDTARAKGWLPPLAWDDIDNPNEHQEGDPVDTKSELDPIVVERIVSGDYQLPTTDAERLEVIRIWQADGISNNEIARRTGWNVWRYQRMRREAS